MKRFLTAILVGLAIPAVASALTTRDVIKLHDSGVGDQVIMSQIESSGDVFRLTVDDILELRQAGVSDNVITFMINTGKNADDSIRSGGVARDGYEESDDSADDPDYSTDVNDDYQNYRTGVDDYYRGYHDATWNVYLRWGWGDYYWPSWWWYGPRHNDWYWYPSYWCGGWWGPWNYASYHHDRGDDRHDRYIKDGRYIGGRGGRTPDGSWDRGGRSGGGQSSPGIGRTHKGNGGYGGRGSGSSGNPGGRQPKNPSYGGRGGSSNRTAPPAVRPPSSNAPTQPSPGGREVKPRLDTGRSGGRPVTPPVESGGGRNAPPPQTSQSGRTKKT